MSKINNALDSEKRFENRIAKEAKQRDFRFAKRTGLLDFGHELFKCGYGYDDFVADIVMIYIYPSEKSKELYDMLLKKYDKINNFLTYEQVISLATNNNYLENILIGYNIERRKNYIAETDKKRK